MNRQILVKGMYREIQWRTGGDRGLQWHTGYVSRGWQGIAGCTRNATVAGRGLQSLHGKCTGADRDCTGDDRENIGVTRKYWLIFIRTVVFRACSVYKKQCARCSASPSNLLFKKNRYQSLYQRKKVRYKLYGF